MMYANRFAGNTVDFGGILNGAASPNVSISDLIDAAATINIFFM